MGPPSPTDPGRNPAIERGLGDRFGSDARGETSLEYGLIASLVVLVLIASLTVFQGASAALYNRLSNAMVNSSQ